MLFGNKKQMVLSDALAQQRRTGGYWSIVKTQFGKNRVALWSLRFLYIFLFVALFGQFIANDKPLYAKLNGEHLFPAFKELGVDLGLTKWSADLVHADWKKMGYQSVIRAPIPYSNTKSDLKNIYKGPFDQQRVSSNRYRHWLGTDALGRDVLAGMIHGTRIAMSVGFVVMSIAAFIGFFFGAVAGYFGDDRLRLSRGTIIMNALGFLFAIYYAFVVRSYAIRHAESLWLELAKSVLLFLVVLLLFNLLSLFLNRISWLGQKLPVAADVIIMRVIELMTAIPGLFFLLAAIPLFREPSVFNVMVLLGLISWPAIARFVRGELIRVRNMNYIEAAQAMGFSEWRVVLKHALPNALTPVLITIAFGIAGAILAESALSFLGIGVDPGDTTWGQLLAKGRNKYSAWWLTVFPGLAIFFTVTIFNLIGEGLTDALDPKQGGQ